jgi:hypothetical protein
MRVNQTARLMKSAAECTALAQQTRDSRAKAVLATAALVWEKLAEQQASGIGSSRVGRLIDLLDPGIADREA